MEKKYRIFFESSRDAIMLLAPPDWLFTIGNKATLEMFGAKNEKEFTSKTSGDLSPEYQQDGQLSTEKARKVIGMAMRNGSFFFVQTVPCATRVAQLRNGRGFRDRRDRPYAGAEQR